MAECTETPSDDTTNKGGSLLSALTGIVSLMGFDKCLFSPDSSDICERCRIAPNDEIYFAGDGFGEGRYMCLDCILDEYHDNQEQQYRIEQLESSGHPSHCAARQVWGDGECECDLYAKRYDPFRWFDGGNKHAGRRG